MNREQYKLQQISDRLWTCAANTALVAALLGRDGRGFAIVAEETRKMSDKMQLLIEQAIFENVEINMGKLKNAALEIMFLAYNAAIESHRLEEKGKQAAVCAEEIRSLAYLLTTDITDEIPLDRHPENVIPWAKTPLTTVISNNLCFFLVEAGGKFFVENLINVEEVCYGLKEENGIVTIRGRKLPVVNLPKFLDTVSDKQKYAKYVILRTPWAEESAEYAVAVDDFVTLFYSPIGTPVPAPADMPLYKYVRECWENENGDPFYFMDWIKMANG